MGSAGGGSQGVFLLRQAAAASDQQVAVAPQSGSFVGAARVGRRSARGHGGRFLAQLVGAAHLLVDDVAGDAGQLRARAVAHPRLAAAPDPFLVGRRGTAGLHSRAARIGLVGESAFAETFHFGRPPARPYVDVRLRGFADVLNPSGLTELSLPQKVTRSLNSEARFPTFHLGRRLRGAKG